MLIIGHRGAKGEAPENTVQSIKRALDDGVDMIEFDLRTTRDGVVVTNHGPFLIKTHGIWRSIARTDFATLRQLTSDKGAPLAALDEILSITAPPQLYVEFKRSSAVVPALEILTTKFPSREQQSKILIASFYPHILRQIRAAWPHAKLSLIFLIPWQRLKRHQRRLGLSVLVTFVKWPLRHDARRAHRLGLKFFIYGVHNAPRLRKARRVRSDAVITNFPERIIELEKATRGRRAT
jgi:glycerophosphoryl diester phosphodiesterase